MRIDWNGLARRARRLTVPGTTIGGLTPAPEGHSVALTVVDRRRRRRRGAARPTRAGGIYIVNVESGQLTRVPPRRAPSDGGGRGGRGGGGGGRFGGGAGMVFARDGRTLYFRSGTGLFAAPIDAAGGSAARRRRRPRRGRRRDVAGAAAAAADAPAERRRRRRRPRVR